MKFKVGDKVRVREYLEVSPCVTCTMVKYKGGILTVEDISGSFYILRECGRMMLWTDEMLEPAEEINPEQYKKDQGQQIKNENQQSCYNCRWKVDNGYYPIYSNCYQCKHGSYEFPNTNTESFWKPIEKTNEKNCDNCKNYNTYFDCSQCEDFDEWQEKPTQKDKPTQAEEINKSTKEVTLTYLESIQRDKEIQLSNYASIAAGLNCDILRIKNIIRMIEESEGE